ncbi:cation/H(+) antiporter 15-like [Zingiber officinale]|uniref:cation/H(+) antiporter 15-like n=1 Tax=Zingiber officinale TaxID=94328 RepID=UPI001C4C4B9A|nr:cation/H(+) antiporter 15-like [Zingiber officinale]XP_042409621.1 cation/H(+) antiporter 15-like [Zingiber officinale]
MALNQTSPEHRMVCYDTSRIDSEGVFLGDKPLLFSVPLFLFELIVVFSSTNLLHSLLRRLHQCRFVSHILTGILLGPSVIGQRQALEQSLFPERGLLILEIISLFGIILYLFNISVKTELNLAWWEMQGRNAVAISVAGSLLPAILSAAAIASFQSVVPLDLRTSSFIYFVILRLSFSSFPVVVDALDELHLLNSALGRLSVASSLLEDVGYQLIVVVIKTAFMVSETTSVKARIGIPATVAAVLLLMVLGGGKAARWVAKRSARGQMLSEGCFLVLLLMALMASIMTTFIGFNMTMGPILLGLAVPGGMPVGATLTERLQPLCAGLLLPLYLFIVGYRTDVGGLDRLWLCWVILLVVVLCYAGKLAGVVAASRHFNKMPMSDAISLGLMLNVKGFVEAFNFFFFVHNRLALPEHLPALTLSMVASTAATTPLIKTLYDPMLRYVVLKRQTVEHLLPVAELHLVVCVHREDHVNPVLDFLDVVRPTILSPLSLVVLHLNQLAGRSAPVFRPHHPTAEATIASDRITNAFHRHFESEQGSVSLSTFVAISPIGSMHNDVCMLALDHKACLALLPFHKHFNGARHTVDHAVQTVNRNVLDFAPCSAAILVGNTLPTRASFDDGGRRVAVYFLGGPDDREALALAFRMARSNISIRLTVVRFLPLQDKRLMVEHDEELMQDDSAVAQVREVCAGYEEKLLKNGEETAALVHRMSQEFELVMVGRRNGMETELTSGLSQWSECPELGIIGDMLAMEFADKIAILVVQQHQSFRGRRSGGGSPENAGGEAISES